jgi:OOP family OmpA-OmpF porin
MHKCLPVLVLVATGLASAGARAADNAAGFYGQVQGGGNHLREQDFGPSGAPMDFDEGGLGSASVGYAFANGLRPEIEYALRQNEAEASAGEAEANGAMGNLWYDFRAPAFAPRLRPYLGGGAGRAEVSLEELAGSGGDGEETVAAYQAGAGLNYDATRSLVVSLGYRFLETEKGRFADATPGTPPSGLDPGTSGSPPIDERYRSDGVLAGIRYVFGREPTQVASAAPPRESAEAAAFETVVLRPVNFQLNRTELTGPSKQTLDEIAQRLKQRADLKITVEGYADSTGSEHYNLDLGQRRAEAVRDYLVSRGVQADNVQVASRGEFDPVADNATETGRAQNRRAQVNTPGAEEQRVKIVIEGPSEESVEAAKEK